MKLLALPLLTLPLLVPGSPTSEELDLEGARALEARVQEVYEQVSPAVVGILILRWNGFQKSYVPAGEGSGVIISPEGLILTVAHNMPDGAGQKLTILTSDGRQLTATSLGRNEEWDFGLAQIDEEGAYPFVEMAPADELAQHEVVLTVGHPNGHRAGRPPVLRIGSTYSESTYGDRRRRVRWIRHTGKIMPGDSGGGVFDLEGRVVGVNSWINANALQNYATSMSKLREQFGRLLAGEEIGRSGRGGPSPLTRLGLRVRSRTSLNALEVLAVIEGSPADKAGLEYGDLLRTLEPEADGEPITLRRVRSLTRFLRDIDVVSEADSRGFTIRATRPGDGEGSGADEDISFDLMLPEDEAPEAVEWDWIDLEPEFESEAAPRVLGRDVNRSLLRAMSGMGSPLEDSVLEVRELDDDDEDPAAHAVVLEDGLLLTIASALRGEVEVRLADGPWVDAERLAEDEETDLLLLRVDHDGLEAATFVHDPDLVPGRLLAATGAGGDLLMAGVIGAPAMRITRQANGFLGVETRDDEAGALISKIVEGTAAERSELRVGDVITHVNGERTSGLNGLIGQLRQREVDELVEFRVLRGAEEIVYDIRIGQRPGRVSDGSMRHVANRTRTNRRKTDYPRVVRHDLNLPPEDVGAPVLDVSGNLVGLHISRVDRPGGFLMPSAQVMAAFQRLKAQHQAALEVEPTDGGR